MVSIPALNVARVLFQTVVDDAYQEKYYPPCPVCGTRDKFAGGGIGYCRQHGYFVYYGMACSDRIELARRCKQALIARGGVVELPEGFRFNDLLGGGDGEHI